MKFSTRHDVDVPAETLFDAVADFDRIERILVRRGTSVRRRDPARDSPMAWDLGFNWRGRRREMDLAVTRFDRPEGFALIGHSEAIELHLVASVVALSRTRSRLIVEVEAQPRTMKARLLLQTAKLTKGRMDRTFATRVAEFVDAALAG